MKEKNNTILHTYTLVHYDRPKPIVPEKQIQMTEREAHACNQGFALNFAKQRYVKVELSTQQKRNQRHQTNHACGN